MLSYIAYAIVLLIILSGIRLVVGPSLWDRLLFLNLITSKMVMLLVIIALLKMSNLYLDIAIFYAILGCIGVIYLALFIQKKGRYK